MVSVLSTLLLLSACGPAPCVDCIVEDAQNYRYTATLDVGSVGMTGGADGQVDWSGLTEDVHGHSRDATELPGAWLLAFPTLDEAEVTAALETDTLLQSDLGGMATCTTDHAGCALSEFGLQGPVAVQESFLPGTGTWLALITSPTEAGGQGLVFLRPEADSTNRVARVESASSTLEVDVDLRGTEPLVVAAADPALVLDLGLLTRDGLGNPLYLPGLDRLDVGRYDESLAALESRVFDLEADAAELWSVPLDGTGVVDLSALAGATPWAGVTRGSTWLLAARCTSCLNPAPRVVLVLDPREG